MLFATVWLLDWPAQPRKPRPSAAAARTGARRTVRVSADGPDRKAQIAQLFGVSDRAVDNDAGQAERLARGEPRCMSASDSSFMVGSCSWRQSDVATPRQQFIQSRVNAPRIALEELEAVGLVECLDLVD